MGCYIQGYTCTGCTGTCNTTCSLQVVGKRTTANCSFYWRTMSAQPSSHRSKGFEAWHAHQNNMMHNARPATPQQLGLAVQLKRHFLQSSVVAWEPSTTSVCGIPPIPRAAPAMIPWLVFRCHSSLAGYTGRLCFLRTERRSPGS